MTTADLRELYRTTPEGFTTARDALVRRLRDEGREDESAEVKKLRRPTVAAWALDRLADEAPDAVDELIDLGAEMMRAQRHVLSGRDPQALRDAGTRRRDVIARLSKTAAELLRAAGRSAEPHLEDIAGTLERASVDEAVGQRLRNGILERTVRPAPGFGDALGLQLVPGADEDEIPASPRARDARPGVELEADVRRLRREHGAAERRVATAEAARARIAAQVETAESRLAAARTKLRGADAAVTEQRLIAKRAAKAFETADRKLRDLRPSEV